jgi:hypothetical protein
LIGTHCTPESLEVEMPVGGDGVSRAEFDAAASLVPSDDEAMDAHQDALAPTACVQVAPKSLEIQM